MSDALPSLLDAIEKADTATALADAVQELADARLMASIPHLIEALSYNNPGAAVAAVDALVDLGQPAVPPLLELLDVNNYTARSWAIRALSGIGDPRGLLTLLGAATADFAMSVRRAAARGLGQMQWHQFPPKLLEVAQAEALEALLFVACQDEEWVVRYAAVVGLESLALASPPGEDSRRSYIQAQLALMAGQEASLSVRARIGQARQMVDATPYTPEPRPSASPSPLMPTDWEQILERLYSRKLAERATSPEGDPKRYQELLSAT